MAPPEPSDAKPDKICKPTKGLVLRLGSGFWTSSGGAFEPGRGTTEIIRPQNCAPHLLISTTERLPGVCQRPVKPPEIVGVDAANRRDVSIMFLLSPCR
jgi:hypothetical protein